MSLRNGIRFAAGKTQKSAGDRRNVPLSSLKFDRSEMTADTALKISAYSECVEIISNSIAIMPSFVMNELSKLHVDKHPLWRVLGERPNEMMTPKQYRQLTQAQVTMYGNSYVWIYRDASGAIEELIPIPMGCCEPWYNADLGTWQYLATEPKTGRPYIIDSADILHYKGFTTNGILGIGTLERARLTLGTAAAMEQYQNDFYRNGGRPSGVLTAEGDVGGTTTIKTPDGDLEIDKKDYIRMQWEKYTGPGSAFKTAILDHGLKYNPIAMTNADAQFIENKNLTVEDICRFCCVPPNKVGVGKQSYNSNEQNNLEFALQTLQPAVTDREQEESYKLLTITERGTRHLRIKSNMAAILRSDAKTRAEVEQIYRQNGVYSVNDICDLEDRPHVPGGDTRYASLNYIPLEFFEALSLARNSAQKGVSGGKEEV